MGSMAYYRQRMAWLSVQMCHKGTWTVRLEPCVRGGKKSHNVYYVVDGHEVMSLSNAELVMRAIQDGHDVMVVGNHVPFIRVDHRWRRLRRED